MDFLFFLLIGLAAGWLASQIMKARGGTSASGIVGNLIVGVIGGILGGWIFSQLGFSTHSRLASLITATVGAILLLALLRLIQKGR